MAPMASIKTEYDNSQGCEKRARPARAIPVEELVAYRGSSTDSLFAVPCTPGQGRIAKVKRGKKRLTTRFAAASKCVAKIPPVQSICSPDLKPDVPSSSTDTPHLASTLNIDEILKTTHRPVTRAAVRRGAPKPVSIPKNVNNRRRKTAKKNAEISTLSFLDSDFPLTIDESDDDEMILVKARDKKRQLDDDEEEHDETIRIIAVKKRPTSDAPRKKHEAGKDAVMKVNADCQTDEEMFAIKRDQTDHQIKREEHQPGERHEFLSLSQPSAHSTSSPSSAATPLTLNYGRNEQTTIQILFKKRDEHSVIEVCLLGPNNGAAEVQTSVEHNAAATIKNKNEERNDGAESAKAAISPQAVGLEPAVGGADKALTEVQAHDGNHHNEPTSVGANITIDVQAAVQDDSVTGMMAVGAMVDANQIHIENRPVIDHSDTAQQSDVVNASHNFTPKSQAIMSAGRSDSSRLPFLLDDNSLISELDEDEIVMEANMLTLAGHVEEVGIVASTRLHHHYSEGRSVPQEDDGERSRTDSRQFPSKMRRFWEIALLADG